MNAAISELPSKPPILKIIFSRRMLVAFLMGFSCGLPLLLTIGVLQAWMKDTGVDLRWIGMITLVQIPYTWKFVWAPLMDRFVPPFLGRRRGWMIMAQLALMLAIAALGYSDPVQRPALMVAAAMLVAFFSATQDIVVDAYRGRDHINKRTCNVHCCILIYFDHSVDLDGPEDP